MRPRLGSATAFAGLVLASIASALPPGQAVLDPDVSLTSTIRDTLLANKVIGDVLDDFEPTYYIDLSYPKDHQRVVLGNDIPVASVSKRPVFTLFSMQPPATQAKESTFTLILTDPDAKSREKPKWSEMCHWVLTNLTTPIPGPPLEILKAKEGELIEYLPPGPPPKTGPHRYVFVLLQGETSKLEAPSDRKHWGYGKPRHGVRDWAEENGLTVVGANFFFAQDEKQ